MNPGPLRAQARPSRAPTGLVHCLVPRAPPSSGNKAVIRHLLADSSRIRWEGRASGLPLHEHLSDSPGRKPLPRVMLESGPTPVLPEALRRCSLDFDKNRWPLWSVYCIHVLFCQKQFYLVGRWPFRAGQFS